MMTKQGIKIIILFILVTIVSYIGWHMYEGLQAHKQYYNENIYDYIPAQACEVFHINRKYSLHDLSVYDSVPFHLVKIIDNQLHLPVIITKNSDNKHLLLMRTGREQAENIFQYIQQNIALHYPPRIKKYKDAEIEIYSLRNDEFLTCTFYKGLFFMSYNYKLVIDAIDTKPTTSFFLQTDNMQKVNDMLRKAPLSIFIKLEENKLALEYRKLNDIIMMDGYILDKQNTDSMKIEKALTMYLSTIPDSICIESYRVYPKNNLMAVKIILNKIY